jgi:flagellar basal body rod protein FlgC
VQAGFRAEPRGAGVQTCRRPQGPARAAATGRSPWVSPLRARRRIGRVRIAIFLAAAIVLAFLASEGRRAVYLARKVEVIRVNIANANTVADAHLKNVPYRRRVVEWGAFGLWPAVREDPTPFGRVWDPGHALAAPDGYYLRPNVDETSERVDLLLTEESLRTRANWLFGVLTLAALSAVIVIWLKNRLSSCPTGRCPACDYDLRATPSRRPECGAVPPPPPPSA